MPEGRYGEPAPKETWPRFGANFEVRKVSVEHFDKSLENTRIDTLLGGVGEFADFGVTWVRR